MLGILEGRLEETVVRRVRHRAANLGAVDRSVYVPWGHVVAISGRSGSSGLRTMCTTDRFPLELLDRPMAIRLTALRSDGTTETGPWQSIEPPLGYSFPTRSTAFVVRTLPPGPRAADPPSRDRFVGSVPDPPLAEPRGERGWLALLAASSFMLAAFITVRWGWGRLAAPRW
jgi:hypothetical protein